MGRPIKYSSEEDRNQAITRSKTKYMVNKAWICTSCGNRDYSLAGKWCHLDTQKHANNVRKLIKKTPQIL